MLFQMPFQMFDAIGDPCKLIKSCALHIGVFQKEKFQDCDINIYIYIKIIYVYIILYNYIYIYIYIYTLFL